MAKDTSKISNADYEIRSAAKTLNVKPLTIHFAKHLVGNNREDVYKWVNENRGKTFTIVIE